MQSKTIIVKSNCMLELSQNVYTQVGAHFHHAFKLKKKRCLRFSNPPPPLYTNL